MDIKKPKLVILGSGFAGFSLLKGINTKDYDVVMVSPRNHFLFTPLLPSTTVGTIEFRSIIEPIRIAKENITFYQASANRLDEVTRTLYCHNALDGEEFSLNYDYLVITVGAAVNTFGIPGVEEHALFLKELWDARKIRQRIIECFERAATPGLATHEVDRLLHFVVVGGGPTGIEFAAEMHDFLEEDLTEWYPALIPFFKITVVEAAATILGSFDKSLSDYATKAFKRQKIDILTRSLVKEIKNDGVVLADGTEIPAGLTVWTGGNGPRDFVKNLPFDKDKAGRLITDKDLRIPNTLGIYALGDCAVIENKNFPATAQVAQQQGKHLSKILTRLARGKEIKPFRYRHLGMLAYVGSHQALADLPNVQGRGFITWVFWRSAYVTKLVSFKNKVLVLFDWFKKLIFGRDISRF
ncbi:FAD-dependent oxidoreductase [bacterium]|nr:FAD-dependent oxidoreductase [bacterium]